MIRPVQASRMVKMFFSHSDKIGQRIKEDKRKERQENKEKIGCSGLATVDVFG